MFWELWFPWKENISEPENLVNYRLSILLKKKKYLLFKTSFPVQAISPNAYMSLGNTYKCNIDIKVSGINCI